MKTLAIFAAATLFAVPALAQQPGGAPGVGDGRSPDFQNGSGQDAGGPANELNASRGPATTGTLRATPGMMDGSASRSPAYQNGSNHRAGGPANELNRR